MAKYGYFCEDIPKSDKKHITTMGKTPTAARHALLACRHMLMAVSAICALAACGGGDELTAPHEHTQDEIKARQYLGYYPCEIDIDDFHGWTADGSYHCSGINKKHLWFAVYDEATTALKLQWFDTARFDRELTYATADGSERTGRISTISADRFIPAQSGGGSPSGWCMAFKATLDGGGEAYVPVIGSTSAKSKLEATATLDALRPWTANSAVVDDKLYNFDGTPMFNFDRALGLPLDSVHETGISMACSGYDISGMTSYRLEDGRLKHIDYVGGNIVWEQDFASRYPDGADIAAGFKAYGQDYATVAVSITYADGTTATETLRFDLDGGGVVEVEGE